MTEIAKYENEFSTAKVLPAINNFNLQKVKDLLVDLLPISPPYYDKNTITDKSERFFVEEIIREKILKHYKKEIHIQYK